MPVLLPPTPVGVPPGHSFWNDWYEKLRQLVNNGAISVIWANIDFAGSNITDIASRAHNNLQSIQGGAPGEYNHLTDAERTLVQNYTHNTLNGIQGGTSGEYYHLTAAQHTAVSGTRILKGVDTTDDLIVDVDTKGLVLKSPDAHYWRITVDNSGVLSTTDLGTTKP